MYIHVHMYAYICAYIDIYIYIPQGAGLSEGSLHATTSIVINHIQEIMYIKICYTE